MDQPAELPRVRTSKIETRADEYFSERTAVLVDGKKVGSVKQNTQVLRPGEQQAYDKKGLSGSRPGEWSVYDASGKRIKSGLRSKRLAIKYLSD